MKKGIQKCTMKWVLTSDVDLSVPLDQVLKWEETMLIKKNKIYFGSRNLSDSKVIKKKYRYILGAILNFLTKKFSIQISRILSVDLNYMKNQKQKSFFQK